MQINKYNPICKQNREQKAHDHLDRCRKSLWQNSASLHYKISEDTGIGLHLNIIKTLYNKPTASIILNWKTKSISSTVRYEQRCPLSPLLFNVVLEFPARAIRKEKEMKGNQIRKEKVKFSLFADDMTLYLKDSKDFAYKLKNFINMFSKVVGCKTNIQKSVAFLYTHNKQA
jgi:hypothetical protein